MIGHNSTINIDRPVDSMVRRGLKRVLDPLIPGPLEVRPKI